MSHTLHCECYNRMQEMRSSLTNQNNRIKKIHIAAQEEIDRIYAAWAAADITTFNTFRNEELEKQNKELVRKNSDLGWEIASLRGIS